MPYRNGPVSACQGLVKQEMTALLNSQLLSILRNILCFLLLKLPRGILYKYQAPLLNQEENPHEEIEAV
jgi:hypothetical protein